MAEKILLGYVAGRELKALIDVLAVTTDQKAELINKATELAKEAGESLIDNWVNFKNVKQHLIHHDR